MKPPVVFTVVLYLLVAKRDHVNRVSGGLSTKDDLSPLDDVLSSSVLKKQAKTSWDKVDKNRSSRLAVGDLEC